MNGLQYRQREISSTVEVKSTSKVRLDDLRHLQIFIDEHEHRAPFGIILHDGQEPKILTSRVVAAPVSWFV